MANPKKRYNKVQAYFLCNFSLLVIECPILIIVGLTSGAFSDSKSGSVTQNVLYWVVMWVISLLFLILIIRSINKKTPKEERVATYFRALWLGIKVAFKFALCFTLIFIPFVMGHRSSVSEKDYYYWGDGDVVRGDDGREFTVCGSFVNVDGNYKKIYTMNGEPYFEDGLNKIWLSDRR